MKRTFLSFTMIVAVLFAGALVASAQSSGYDLMQTGSGASIDLSSQGLGVVPLQGVPIQSSTGNADTIMYRPQSVPSGGGSTPVVVNALFMKSQSSVTFQNQQADVYVTINNSGGQISTSVLPQPDALSGSSGSLDVRTDGTFDSNISVNADVIFVSAGTSVTDSANWLGHQAASAISLSSTNSTWSSTPPPNYPSAPCYPSGGFYPKPVHAGPHPVVPAQTTTSSGGGTLQTQTAAMGQTVKNAQGGRKPSTKTAVAVDCVAITTTQ
jgi:hypothetical protein